MLTIAADPRHLGARIGITSVLHSWGSAMTHHPHIHMIVPGGGLAKDGSGWVSCKPNFCLPVRVLSKLFRRLMLTKLAAAHAAGKLQFFGAYAHLTAAKAFAVFLAPLTKTRWFVYTKRPLAGPKAVLAYLSRYTHRVAISNRRLIALNERSVTFKVKDYRIKGPRRYTTMTLDVGEFIRRFLSHVLPKGFHRIRHYGLFASSNAAIATKRSKPCANSSTWPHLRPRRQATPIAATTRAPLPLLRPHDHHPDLRGRLPATPPANHASRDSQDRYLVSVDTSHTTARFFRAGHPPATPLLASILLSIAFRVVRIAETQRQHRSFKPNLPIGHPQSQHPTP
jgi:hypothetical protein